MESTERAFERGDLALLASVVTVAFLVRLVVLFQVRELAFVETLIGDARGYDAWAAEIRAGDWRGEGAFYQAPLYPYVLAVLQALAGGDLFVVRALHAALGSCACGLAFLAGRLFLDRRAGAIAGLLLAFYAPAVFLSLLIQKSALAAVLVTGVLWMLARAQSAPRLARFVAAGATLGALALTREEALGIAPLLALWTWLRFRNLRWVGGLVLGCAALLAPVAVRNVVVGGELALTTTQAGPNFYIGNHAGASGTYAALRVGRGDARFEREDAARLAEVASGRPLEPGEVSRYWLGEALAFIRSDPGAWVRLLARKARLAFHAYEAPDTIDQLAFEEASGVLRGLATVFHFGTLLPLAAAGLVCAWRHRRDLGVLLVWVGGCAFWLIAFYIFARYRFPLVPALAILAGAGFSRLRAEGLSWKPLAALACAALLANAGDFASAGPARALIRASTAVALLDRGANDAAARACEEAIALDPDCLPAWSNLAIAHMRAGRAADGARAFQRAVELRPNDPRTHKQLGTALAEIGDSSGAREHLARSVELLPHDQEAAANLTFLLQRDRDWPALARHLAERARIAPEDERAQILRAWLLATCRTDAVRDGTLATEIARRLCGSGCTDPDRLDVLAAALAESGDFQGATAAATRAFELAPTELRSPIAARLEGYRARRPWRE
ncbi:MAG: tetratricopeptide repeat protein [bacterium]|nr:tetratricopeptide repeat protein [bacterium]